MKKRTPIKWRDAEGDEWQLHHDEGYLWDSGGTQFRRDTVEKRWGPLVPVEWEKPPTLWHRATATWQRRLTLATTILMTLICLTNGTAAIIRGVDPTWHFIGPILFGGGFVLLCTGLILTLVWIWPSLKD